MSFLSAIVAYDFLQMAVLAAVLVSVPSGIVGSYVVARRITYIAGGIAHCVLGGIGIARYAKTVWGWQWLDPLYGAILAAIMAAILIGLVSLYAKEREDTVIGALWAMGMAVGVLFMYITPGYNENIISYLFGNILMISPHSLILMALLNVFVVIVGLLFYRRFLAICFDEEFARIRGIQLSFYYILLLVMVALTVVLLVTVVGIVLVIALLTLPAAAAGRFTRSLRTMMVLAAIFTLLSSLGGLAVSYAPNLPAGACIILCAGSLYLASIFYTYIKHR